MYLHIYISYELYDKFDYTMTLRIYSPYDLHIIMANPLPNNGVNLPEDEQVQPNLVDPKIIYPYEIEEGELPPPPADSGTSSNSDPKVEAEDEDGDEATVGTITQTSYSVPPFSGTIYVGSGPSRKVFAPGPIGNNVDMLQRKVKGLA
uniref:Uncharacterized protein n=1 Tax=Tanacetum cinerariifolium TaxID=118510 RepID=A0A699QVC2_TANCI|nr:hypothetical protein [Tanacetum cinerariifolium]